MKVSSFLCRTRVDREAYNVSACSSGDRISGVRTSGRLSGDYDRNYADLLQKTLQKKKREEKSGSV